MTEVDINFITKWSNSKFEECRQWITDHPRFGDFDVDEETGIMKFDNEQDAILFILRWT